MGSNEKAAKLGETQAADPTVQGRRKRRELVAAIFNKVPPRVVRMLLRHALPRERLLSILSELFAGDPDIKVALASWSEQYLRSFKSFEIEPDLERLLGLGIRRETVARAMMAVSFSPQIAAAFRELLF